MAADLTAGKGWDVLVGQHAEAADRAWVAITSDPRRTDSRQHQLKGSLSTATVSGRMLEHWQFEVTAGGRIWYAIDDQNRILWLTQARSGHPKQTETQRRKKR